MKKCIVLLLSLMCSIVVCRGNHAMGLDITYECTGPNTYYFKAYLYRNCGGLAAPGSVTINFTSVLCAQTFSATLPNSGWQNVSQLCGVTPSTYCSSAPSVGKYIYEGTVVFPAQCSDWTGSYSLNARNAGITNIVNPIGQDIYVDFMINNSNGICNNSASFSASPIPYMCANMAYCYNMGTVENDGDSLVFELIGARGAQGAPIAYNAGYTPQQPIATSPPMSATFDPATGQLCFTPSMAQQSVVVVKIYEYRNGVLIGTQMRDMQFMVQSCSNAPPVLTNTNFNYEICAGDSIAIPIHATDPNSGNVILFISNSNSAIPGSSFTNYGSGSNPDSALFSWQTQLSDAGTYNFTVQVRDSVCPTYGMNYYSFTIKVSETVEAGPDAYYCPGGNPVQLEIYGTGNYNWTPATGLSCSNCPDPIAAPSATTTYIVSGDSSPVCKYIDTVTVNVVSGFTLVTSADDTVCRYSETTISATATPATAGGFSYNWSPSGGLSSDTVAAPVASPILSTQYAVTVTAANGCQITDSVKLTVNGVAPQATLFVDDPVICPGDTVQLEAIVYEECGLSAFNCIGPGTNYEIGTGTTSTNSASPLYGNALLPPLKRQYIYHAADLLAMGATEGNITEIALNISSIPIVNNPYIVNIKMGCTTDSYYASPTSGFITGLVPVKNNYTMQPSVTGWYPVALDAPFHWDGVSNIVVEFCFNVGSFYAFNVMSTYTGNGYQTLTYTTISPSADGCFAVSGSRVGYIPNMRFTICQAAPPGIQYSWTPSVGVFSPTSPNTGAIPQSTGSYQLSMFYTSDPGCVGTESIAVAFDTTNTVIASASDSTVCPGTQIQLQATTTGPPVLTPVVCGSNGNTCTTTSYDTLGTGSYLGGSTSTFTPFAGWYSDYKMQMIFTASELEAAGITAGTISSISFFVGSQNSSLPFSNFTVAMGCTPREDFAYNTGGWETGLTTVMGPTSYTTTMGVNTLNFSTTYDWDGVSNLIVQLCFDNTSYTFSDPVRYSYTGYLATMYRYADNSTGCSLTPLYRTSYRPNIIFGHCDPPAVPLVYQWTPQGSVSNDTIANPTAIVNTATTYTVNVVGTACPTVDSVSVILANPPSALIANGGTACPGSPASVDVSFTGSGPWVFEYFDGVDTNTVTTSSNPYSLPATVAGTYSLISVADANCQGTVSGSAIVTNPPPITISNVSTVCNVNMTGYTVTFEITGGDSTTYTVSPAGGTLTPGNPATFTSNLLASGSSYTFLVTDSSGCSSQTVSGSFSCACSASASISGGGTVCPGDSAAITVNLTGNAPWTFVYSSGSVANLVNTINTPYTFYASSPGTYTLQSVSDSSCTGSVSGSAVITSPASPVATISGGDTLCAGQSASLSIALSGTAPWTVTYTNGTNVSTISTNTSPYNFTTQTAGTYTISAVSDAYCSGTGSGSATVVQAPTPSAVVSGGGTYCQGDTGYVSVSLTGTAPWVINWTGSNGLTGTVTSSNPAYQLPVTSGGTYQVTSVSDAFCSGTASGQAMVAFMPKPVATVSGGGSVCQGDSVSFQVNFTGTGPWNFAITNGSATQSYSASSSPFTGYLSVPGTWTVASVQDANCSGSGQGSAQVVVNPAPSAAIWGGGHFCPGDSASVSISFTGNAPFTAVYSDGVNQTTITSSGTYFGFNTGDSATYTLISMSDASCTGTVSGSALTEIEEVPTVTISGGGNICQGDSAAVTFTFTGGSPWYYNWSDGYGFFQDTTNQAVVTHYGSQAGNYTISAMADHHCVGTINGSAGIIVYSAPVLTVAPSNPEVCNGNNVTLTGSGASSYTWSGGPVVSAAADSVVVNPTVNTTYYVSGTDANGCTGTDSVSVVVNQVPVIQVSPQNPVICPGGSVTLSASGATSWLWSPSTGLTPSNTAATVTASPSVTTTYTVIGTGPGGCTNSASVTVTVDTALAITVTPQQPTICAGDTVLLSASGGDTYSWTPGTGLSGTAGNQVLAFPSTTSSYTVTGTSLAGCTGTASVTVIVNPVPVVTVSPSQSDICAGSCVNMMASGAQNYVWSGNGLGNLTGSSNTVCPSDTLTITVTGTDSSGCSSTAQSVINVAPSPQLTIIASRDTVCPGSPDTLTVTGGSNYTWTGAGLSSTTGNQVTAFPAAATVYSVSGTNGLGCTGYDSITIYVDTLPTIAVSPSSPSICAGDTVSLTASGADQYSWSPSLYLSASSGAMVNAAPASTITYTVYGVSASGCVNDTSVTVSVNPAPPVNVSPSSSVLCPGDSVLLTASGAQTYSWSPSSSLGSVNGNSVYAFPTSLTTVTVTGTDTNGCSSSANATVNTVNFPDISATASPEEFCPGETVSLTVTPVTSGVNYFWTGNNGFTATGSGVSDAPVSNTTYQVVAIHGSAGCSDTAQVDVELKSPPQIIMPADTSVCEGSPANLTAQVTGGNGAFTYLWTSQGIPVSSASSATVSPATSGWYVLNVESCGSDEDSVFVTVNPRPDPFPLENISGCSPLSANFYGSPAFLCHWDFGDGNTSDLQIAGNTYENPGYYTFSLVLTDPLTGCSSLPSQAQANVISPPVASFDVFPDVLTMLNPVISLNGQSSSQDVISWHWEIEGYWEDSLIQTDWQAPQAGAYPVVLTVSNGICSDTAMRILLVEEDFAVYIPNAFTPNQDQLNEGFGVSGVGLEASTEFRFDIYDRWGALVFSTNDPRAVWDGTYRGEEAPQDVYVYSLVLRTPAGNMVIRNGHVSLIR